MNQSRLAIFNPDGSVYKQTTTFGQPGRGVFQVDEANETLEFISAMEANQDNLQLPDLRSDSRFVKAASVLGYETLVLRSTDENGSGAYDEVYYAPGIL